MLTNLLITTKDRIYGKLGERPGAYKLLAAAMAARPKAGKRPRAEDANPAPATTQASLFEEQPKAVEPVKVEPAKVETPAEAVQPIAIVTPSQPEKTRGNPFAAEPAKLEKLEQSEAPVIPVAQAPVIPAQQQPVIPVKQISPLAFLKVVMPLARRAWKWVLLFCKRLVQRFVFGRKGRPVRPASVQTELALDNVTVMRNNLSEDDLEVVLVQREVGRGAKPLASLSKVEMTGDAWTRLTAPFRKKHSASAINPKAVTNVSPELSARA